MLESLCSLMSAVIGCNGVDDSCTVCRELSLCVLWTRWHQRMRGNEIKWQHITSLFLCRTFDRFYLVVKSGQVKLGGSESMEASRVGNLAHFVHKRTLFNMDNTIINIRGSCSMLMLMRFLSILYTKNYWNRSTFDRVILKTKRWSVFWGHSVHIKLPHIHKTLLHSVRTRWTHRNVTKYHIRRLEQIRRLVGPGVNIILTPPQWRRQLCGTIGHRPPPLDSASASLWVRL